MYLSGGDEVGLDVLRELRERVLGEFIPSLRGVGALPRVLPVVGLGDSRLLGRVRGLGGVVVRFQEVLERGLVERVLDAGGIHGYLGYDGLVIHSPVMPDEMLTEENLGLYIDFSRRAGFDAVVGWDAPTYLDAPLEVSWYNTLVSMRATARIARSGLPTIPLVNGATLDQVEFSAKVFRNLGFKAMALHATDYVYYGLRKPLLPLARAVLRYADHILLLGSGGPGSIRWFEENLLRPGRIHYSTYSWRLRAEEMRAYLTPGKPVDLSLGEAVCTCPACRTAGEAVRLPDGEVGYRLASRGGVEAHNLQLLIEPEHRVEAFDAVIQGRKAVFIADLHIGLEHGPEPLWERALRAVVWENPDYLFILGDTFDFRLGTPYLDQIEGFFDGLVTLNAKIVPVLGEADLHVSRLRERMLQLLSIGKDSHYDEIGEPPHPRASYVASMLARYYMAAKKTLRVLSDELIIATHKPPRRRPGEAVLVTAHTHKAWAREGWYSLGCWVSPTPRHLLRGVEWDAGWLLIHEKDGKLELVEVK